jgi:hypothetical protein
VSIGITAKILVSYYCYLKRNAGIIQTTSNKMSEKDPYTDKKRNEAGGMDDTSPDRTGKRETEEDTADAGLDEEENEETEEDQ